MRKTTLLISLCYSSFSFAQNKIEYANFIQTDTAVKWAAIYTSYVNLTPVNPNFNIRNFYINKLKQLPVKAYLQDSLLFTVTPVEISYSDLKKNWTKENYSSTKMNWKYDFDDNHDASEPIFRAEFNACDSCLSINKLTLLKVKQLLYYKNNQLRIQNILFSPILYTKETLWHKEDATFYSNIAFGFNNAAIDETAIPSTAKYIGRAGNDLRILPTESDNDHKILTLNNWSLGYQLYQDIKKKRIKAYATDKSIYPSATSMLDPRKIEQYHSEPITVAVFDDDGYPRKYKKMIPEMNFDSVYNYTLIQDFYFDFTSERLYSKLIAFVPRINIVTSAGINLGLTNYWGVQFAEEKKLAKPRSK
jgi:hypothetical protein